MAVDTSIFAPRMELNRQLTRMLNAAESPEVVEDFVLGTLNQYPGWVPKVGFLGGERIGNEYRSPGREFVGYNFDGFIFNHGLVGTTFFECSMRGARLTGDLQLLFIEGCDLSASTISGDLSGTEIYDGSLERSDMSKVNVIDLGIQETKISGVDLAGAALPLMMMKYLHGNNLGKSEARWVRSLGRIAKPHQVEKALSAHRARVQSR